MSEQNVAAVRHVAEAFLAGLDRGDPAGMFDSEFVAEDLEWVQPPGFPGPATYRGRAGFAEFVRSWMDAFDELSIELKELRPADGDRVVGLFQHRGVGSGSGVPVELTQGVIYELERGRVVRCLNFGDGPTTLKAAGLAD